jgi:hypothetical protein
MKQSKDRRNAHTFRKKGYVVKGVNRVGWDRDARGKTRQKLQIELRRDVRESFE